MNIADYTHLQDVPDAELLIEYASEIDGDTRRISSDPPSKEDVLEKEILRRMESRIY